MSTEISCAARGGTFHILMNRPTALNALNLAMIRDLSAGYAAAVADPSIHCVLLEGAGGKAFCAGGDVKGIWEAARAGAPITTADVSDNFFREEYVLNAAIASCPKPQISVWGKKPQILLATLVTYLIVFLMSFAMPSLCADGIVRAAESVSPCTAPTASLQKEPCSRCPRQILASFQMSVAPSFSHVFRARLALMWA